MDCYVVWKGSDKSKGILCVALSELEATLIGMLLCGCSGSSSNSRFVKVENYGITRYVLVDTETNVLYLRFDRGITVLLNADGTPMLWGE